MSTSIQATVRAAQVAECPKCHGMPVSNALVLRSNSEHGGQFQLHGECGQTEAIRCLRWTKRTCTRLFKEAVGTDEEAVESTVTGE